MSERATLLALADRCEAASGPDRKLDRLIDHHKWPIKQPDYHLALSLRDEWDVPAFTASIDAALTLVPEGWTWSLDQTQRAPYRDCGRADLYAPGGGIKPADISDIYAATPALAICAAALRALAEVRQ